MCVGIWNVQDISSSIKQSTTPSESESENEWNICHISHLLSPCECQLLVFRINICHPMILHCSWRAARRPRIIRVGVECAVSFDFAFAAIQINSSHASNRATASYESSNKTFSTLLHTKMKYIFQERKLIFQERHQIFHSLSVMVIQSHTLVISLLFLVFQRIKTIMLTTRCV